MSSAPAQQSLFGLPEGKYVRVALDTPVRREFSYWAPPDLSVEPGARVRVPFGSRQRVGVAVGIDPHPPVGVDPARVRPITALLDEDELEGLAFRRDWAGATPLHGLLVANSTASLQLALRLQQEELRWQQFLLEINH